MVAHGDIWLASLAEAAATAAPSSPLLCARLTAQGSCSHPCFSPDGKQLAYSAAFADGSSDATEVYVVESGGRGLSPRRLTYLGAACEVAGWTPDGSHVLFRTSAEQPMSHLVQLWMVPCSGLGRPSPLNVGVSHHLVSQVRPAIKHGQHNGR